MGYRWKEGSAHIQHRLLYNESTGTDYFTKNRQAEDPAKINKELLTALKLKSFAFAEDAHTVCLQHQKRLALLEQLDKTQAPLRPAKKVH